MLSIYSQRILEKKKVLCTELATFLVGVFMIKKVLICVDVLGGRHSVVK